LKVCPRLPAEIAHRRRGIIAIFPMGLRRRGVEGNSRADGVAGSGRLLNFRQVGRSVPTVRSTGSGRARWLRLHNGGANLSKMIQRSDVSPLPARC